MICKNWFDEECNKCDEWYHLDCIGFLKSIEEAEKLDFLCFNCLQNEDQTTINMKKKEYKGLFDLKKCMKLKKNGENDLKCEEMNAIELTPEKM